MDAAVKEERIEPIESASALAVKEEKSLTGYSTKIAPLIDLSSSDSDLDDSDDSDEDDPSTTKKKRRRLDGLGIVLPLGFLDPLPPPEPLNRVAPPPLNRVAPPRKSPSLEVFQGCKQFWKAGDFDDGPSVDSSSFSSTVGMDHVRVHPKFLHSNATSHKWALGAVAELLDNALDEACNGATFVNVDMLHNMKDGSKMLLIEDNGGGMDPDKMRQCMSLGYSAKSKLANTIGQYGNGFKTSTMRLGADVIVFSRCRGKDGKSLSCLTQSIGMLSLTFLKGTKKEDIVVPMVDYEKGGSCWKKLMRSSPDDWSRNLETILYWSPYSSEMDLLGQFDLLNEKGTRIIIYNLWDNDQGELELDFETDKHSYASILYLRLPTAFRIVLRGKDVEHHNIINDMMVTQEITYKPQPGVDGIPRDQNMVAIVTIGFVKDAKDHIDVQGFNVYHKNRLIKPFWRVWNATGSDGRGVIGVLEANFVEPAHDKQGFERTIVLSRLEARLVQMQKTFWHLNCHKIGYAPRNSKAKQLVALLDGSATNGRPSVSVSKKVSHYLTKALENSECSRQLNKEQSRRHVDVDRTNHRNKSCSSSASAQGDSDCDMEHTYQNSVPYNDTCKVSPAPRHSSRRDSPHSRQSNSYKSDNSGVGVGGASNGRADQSVIRGQQTAAEVASCRNANAFSSFVSPELDQLKIENLELRERIKKMEESLLRRLEFETVAKIPNGDVADLKNSDEFRLKVENIELKASLKKMEQSFQSKLQFERDRCTSLEAQANEVRGKMAEISKEQEVLCDIFSEERNQKDAEIENLRKKLKDASNTIQRLLEKVRSLEKMKSPNDRSEHSGTVALRFSRMFDQNSIEIEYHCFGSLFKEALLMAAVCSGSHYHLRHHRKLLETGKVEPSRAGIEARCTTDDIVVNQGPTTPLPSGIPTYTVQISNVCDTGCDISHIHLSCGWFSSARLINPTIFHRIDYDDCLVNGGHPLRNGDTISFAYANSFSYPLSVLSVSC
ncbi:hypothetical protein Scep_018246 [Stephania cephalantha]|uniref:Morc S5 domain-containing protein n=1 Tax=Stephania cephalantha TaxID=152367 RepID=A0AAP0ISF6_9MAGN